MEGEFVNKQQRHRARLEREEAAARHKWEDLLLQKGVDVIGKRLSLQQLRTLSHNISFTPKADPKQDELVSLLSKFL